MLPKKKELIVWPLVKKRFICHGPDNIPQTIMNMNLIFTQKLYISTFSHAVTSYYPLLV
jgi:hypothetical protein